MGNGGSKKSERVVRRKRRRHVKYDQPNRHGVPMLYVWPSSAPCRAINPHHTVPTLTDGDYNLWESRAIAEYLVGKYEKFDCGLFPKSKRIRALMRQFLAFDSHSLHPDVTDYLYPQLAKNLEADKIKESCLSEEIDIIEEALTKSEYLAGDTLTLADLFVCSTITLLELISFDFRKWPNVLEWLERIKSQEFYVPANMGHETWKIVLSERKQQENNDKSDAEGDDSSIDGNYNENYNDNYDNSL